MKTIGDIRPRHNLNGQVFGKLTVLGLAGRGTNGANWLCKCSCGGLAFVGVSLLRRGATRSCGCLVFATKNTTHGLSKTPEYRSYDGAKSRCNNPNHPQYFRYGGRGIQFLFASFQEFLEELGSKPSREYTVDRIDNNGHYEKGNVRWATPQSQAQNRRSNHLITYNGVTKVLQEWMHEFPRLEKRLGSGWCEHCSFYLPVHRRSRCEHRQYKYNWGTI